MRIEIETINHMAQRYPTVGDWYYKEGVLVIKVSRLSDWKREALVAVHELVEVLLCQAAQVSQEAVDEFDKAYEIARPVDDTSEPGDDPKAPYRRPHCVATAVERLLAAELGVSWREYEDERNRL